MREDRERYAESDPRHHTIKIRGMLSEVRDHLREDVSKVEDPRAEALFETTAEVLGGLILPTSITSEERKRPGEIRELRGRSTSLYRDVAATPTDVSGMGWS